MTSVKSHLENGDSQRSQMVNRNNEDSENIPYHAREHARPFTYGNLPDGFKTSDLNHVVVKDLLEEPKHGSAQGVLPVCPAMVRRSARPSISPSRPLLRKTPSREEFEEMLVERRQQAMCEQNTIATKLMQNAGIQKDLDELQKKLNKKVITSERPSTIKFFDMVRFAEAIDNPKGGRGEHKYLNTLIKPNKHDAKSMPSESSRPETPSFPDIPNLLLEERCISPYPMVEAPPSIPDTPILQQVTSSESESSTYLKSESKDTLVCQRGDNTNDPKEVEQSLVKFVKDLSEFWYFPYMTRSEAVALLRNTSPGTFIIRKSTTYKNAYGLVLRVARAPPGIFISEYSSSDELVRHFLLEPTSRGILMKGCPNEPIFTSLSAFVYQHSIDNLALPCKLVIPYQNFLHLSGEVELLTKQKKVLELGAACNVLYLYTCDMESLTGEEAIRKAIQEMFTERPTPIPTEVHFKVSKYGITITDKTRRLFFRHHYTSQNISYIGLDPENRSCDFAVSADIIETKQKKQIFSFVARPLIGSKDNQCHIFSDLAANQPATAIISFANKVLPMDKQNNKML